MFLFSNEILHKRIHKKFLSPYITLYIKTHIHTNKQNLSQYTLPELNFSNY